MLKHDEIKMQKLKAMGYELMSVHSASKGYSFVLFIKSEYKRTGYPLHSAYYRHHADFIYDRKTDRWTKEAYEIPLTKAEEVLYGCSKNSV